MHVGMASGSTASGLAVPAASTTAPACPASTTLFVRRATGRRCRRRRALSCRASGGLLWLPRRDVLAGLTGMAAAGALAARPDLDPASAALQAASEDGCRRGDKVTAALLDCLDKGLPCPPSPDGVKLVDFEAAPATKRVRRPVHLLSPEEAAKYKEAVAKMKELDLREPNNPLSFSQQAAIHEAYCDGHYRYDPAEKNRPFNVHFSWIFAPWHRMYIYFYERALGDLIGDDTFALPYWNWDAPTGMVVPPLFRESIANPLYDKNRNKDHLDKLIHLDFAREPLIRFNPPPDMATEHKKAVEKNLSTMYQQMIRSGKGARCFLGEKLCSEASFRVNEINERSRRRQGNAAKFVKLKRGNTQGALERMAHAAVHVWVGRPEDRSNPAKCGADPDAVMGHDGDRHCANDMGFLGSAARDPIFYSHHSNVDRMWHLWSTKLGGRGFDDPEWRDASFVFYGGPKTLVRIKVSDVLDTANLGYTYDDAGSPAAALPWINSKPTPLVPHGGARGPPAAGATPKPPLEEQFPVTLAANAVVEVPSVPRPAKEKDKVQVLVVDGIEYDPTVGNTFVVAINVPEGKAREVGPQHSEYAGVFSAVPSSKDQEEAKAKNISGVTLGAKLSLVLDDLLADIGADGDDAVDVVFVGGEKSGEITINIAPRIQNEEC